MEVVGDPAAEMPVFDLFRRALAKGAGEAFRLASLERFAFYERAKAATVIVVTGEATATIAIAAVVMRPNRVVASVGDMPDAA